MAAHAEDYLESLLIDAFKGKGYQKISDLLQERETDTLQKYSNSLLSQLDKALRRELDKNDFHNVSLLLKCIQLYFKSDLQQGTSLFIEQGLVEKMTWFERARTFVILIDPTENSFLMVLLEDFFDSALVICKCSNEGKKQLVNLFLPELGRLVTEASICCALRQEALRTLNSILDSVPREGRKKLPLSEEVCFLTKDLAKTMLEAGDYDLQVALSEALCRLTIKKWRDDLVNHWFEDKYLAEAFKEIKDKEFETDCRKFLNQLNERLGDKRRVYSFPCLSAFADVSQGSFQTARKRDQLDAHVGEVIVAVINSPDCFLSLQVKKPSDEKLDKFWIDFNTGSHSVTFYIDSTEGVLWDSVRLQKEAVSCYSLKEDGGEKIVKIYMKIPATLNKTEATKIKLHFSAEYEIFSILRKVLGDEKMMANMGEEESIHNEKQTRQSEEVTSQSSDLQKKKDPENFENMESIAENLISQHNEQLVGTVAKTSNSDVAMSAVNQQSGLDEADQGSEKAGKQKHLLVAPESEVSLSPSANKSKTQSPRMDMKSSEKPSEEKLTEASMPKVGTLEKRTRTKGLVKQKTGGRKDCYDFEVSDSASHEKVAEAKEKVFMKKNYSQNQSYRKHLFSESNNEKTSNSESEKSWILNSQKELLPKSLSYTRKRRRVRRKLKVLPVSSPSSSNENQMEEQGAARQKDEMKASRKKHTSTSKSVDLPTVDLAGDVPSEEPKGTWQPLDVSMEEHSGVEEEVTQKFRNVSGEETREEESFKRKDSDALSGTVVKKPRFFSSETKHLSSESPFKPKKLLNSVEKKEEIKRDQETVDVSTAFLSKIQHEDIGDAGVIAVFESFTNQLKQLFWSRYKEMEMSAQNTLKTSEKNVSALLKEIHECRLNKLEAFKKIVVEELASLEKDTQILRNMEKDAVDFWNAQLHKLNSFCNQQKQRIQSVDSALGETAESFASTIVNTAHNVSMKSAVENGVFVVPSD